MESKSHQSIYNLTGLGRQHFLELFYLHSFNQSHPPQEFKYVVKKFPEACGGPPLSSKVFLWNGFCQRWCLQISYGYAEQLFALFLAYLDFYEEFKGRKLETLWEKEFQALYSCGNWRLRAPSRTSIGRLSIYRGLRLVLFRYMERKSNSENYQKNSVVWGRERPWC